MLPNILINFFTYKSSSCQANLSTFLLLRSTSEKFRSTSDFYFCIQTCYYTFSR
ncbi:hypothetical protein C5167_039813, partial [Papaver somniferum]